MAAGRPLTQSELDILTAVGYLVMKWNYAEYCARQIIRMYIPGGALDDAAHLKLSSKMAKWIEDELRDSVLPRWNAPGDAYLRNLIDSYARTREHRNKVVHGVWTTSDSHGPHSATALLLNSKPVDGKSPHPEFITIEDLRPLIEHFADLADFSQKVMVAFDGAGNLMLNGDGTPSLPELPSLVTPLPSCKYDTI